MLVLYRQGIFLAWPGLSQFSDCYVDHTQPVCCLLPDYFGALVHPGYSLFSGYYAWRNRERGSWYIEAVVKIFMKYAKCEDICAMLNRVCIISFSLPAYTPLLLAQILFQFEFLDKCRYFLSSALCRSCTYISAYLVF